MANPVPPQGLTVKIKSYNAALQYLNTNGEIKTELSKIKGVSNYEYEVDKNEEKRNILILKPQYLQTFIGDMKNIMKHSKSSQYVDGLTKKTYNPNITGI